MPRPSSSPRRGDKRGRRRLPGSLPVRAAVMVLHRRLAEVERRLERVEGKKKRIGFVAVDVQGDRHEQDPDSDWEDIPEEVP